MPKEQEFSKLNHHQVILHSKGEDEINFLLLELTEAMGLFTSSLILLLLTPLLRNILETALVEPVTIRILP